MELLLLANVSGHIRDYGKHCRISYLMQSFFQDTVSLQVHELVNNVCFVFVVKSKCSCEQTKQACSLQIGY